VEKVVHYVAVENVYNLHVIGSHENMNHYRYFISLLNKHGTDPRRCWNVSLHQ
jgi:hypothetical protein